MAVLMLGPSSIFAVRVGGGGGGGCCDGFCPLLLVTQHTLPSSHNMFGALGCVHEACAPRNVLRGLRRSLDEVGNTM